MPRPIPAVLAALFLLPACSSTPSSDLHPVLWMRTSAEYEALCLQAFATARAALDRALADPSWTACQEQGSSAGKPPAIIVDVDETVLSTTEQVARRVLSPDAEEDFYSPWVALASAPPLPGAREFLTEAAARGVTVFYVTNRIDTLHDDTVLNLKNAGLPLAEGRDTVLCYSQSPDKGPRRAAICKDFRVLLQIGDAGGDFVSSMAARTPAERRAIAEEFAAWWGERWIVLPNPAMGDWLRAVWGWKEAEQWEHDFAERDALRHSLPAPKPKD